MVVSESYLALGVFKLNLRLDHNPGKDQIARAYAQEIIAGNLNLKKTGTLKWINFWSV